MISPELSRDASGRLAITLFDVPMESFLELTSEIQATFALEADSLPRSNLADRSVITLRRGEARIETAWDNWSGFIVTSLNESSDALVNEIYAWFGTA
ncbi:hypothetical protein [Rhodopirellula sp. MGV]|uniref:hypothetical protein n=1 Tax=Rhodopirellula sp. MGV TaxID=2023130 RepID=UPI000B97839C|nr:hypothetical protein [Rhodopirellula sp. MGV]OYP39190.1 hypothetical protein CGZ80_00665 [Rhodopirellula sp. MGV]PNY35433.1 hypothetical protein C2E31_18175 [Rhodopirellula baltica]